MKTILITGAASGIGLALTKTCLQKGHAVILIDKNQEALTLAVNHLMANFNDQMFPFVCDITNQIEVSKLAMTIKNSFKHIDWVFNNAGIIGTLAPAWELSQEDIQTVMNVNIHGMMNIIRAFMPLLLAQKTASRIINIASLYALCAGSQTASYAMSKHAVLALSESLYFDLKRLDAPINISVAFPSFTDTGLLSAAPTQENSYFHEHLSQYLSFSKPALDVAQNIIKEIEDNQFYIFPDKEVKDYCSLRTNAMLNENAPHLHTIEKLIQKLLKREASK